MNYDAKIKEISEKLEIVEENFKDNLKIEVKIKEIDAKIHILDNEMKAIEKGRSLQEFVNKINIFESNLITMKKALTEKDKYIHEFENGK